MKTLPTHPSARRLSPCTGEAQTPVTVLFAMGTWTLFYTTLLPPPLPPHHPPHLGSERVSPPYFTQDHVVGALFPPPALSILTWTEHLMKQACPGLRAAGSAGRWQGAASPASSPAPALPCLSPEGRQT